jgi:tetratricopeptide (TPR) repeat protein
VLREPAPPADWPYTRGVWHYARGLAFNARDRAPEARGELAELEKIVAAVSPERTLAFFFRTRNMLQLAANVLAGELAARNADTASAARLLRAAVAEQDTHWFTEPPPWYFPVRQALGAVLLQAGRAREAEQVYREDLDRNPNNGWSLFGLAESLRAQGKAAEAAEADARFRKAWAQADVELKASRF